ncbi:hypothetical protein Tco_0319884 [Tanacetum coccineum]
MEEIVTKFINESKREHEDMETFIREFRTTSELLLNEQNNLLSELSIGVHELSRVLNNVLFSRNKIKGITTREGKMTSVGAFDNEISKSTDEPNEPSRLQHDKPETPCEVVFEKEPPKIREPVAETAMEKQKPPILFPNRMIKEKEEAQQPKCSTFLLNKLPSKEKDLGSFTIPCQISTLNIDNALANLGSSISLMPYTMYERLGDDQVTFDMEQSMKRPPTEDDESYSGDDLDETISKEARALLENEQLDSFLVTDLEKTITQADQEYCNSVTEEFMDNEQVLEKRKGAIAWKIPWVNPIHVVLKKGGMTVVLNDNNEFIPSQTVTGWIFPDSNCTRRSRENDVHLTIWNIFLSENAV